MRQMRPWVTVLSIAALWATTIPQTALAFTYTCEEAANVASKVAVAKEAGHSLEEVLEVLKASSAEDQQKEIVVTGNAIAVYGDSSITPE